MTKWSFPNYVYKRRWVGSPKTWTSFVNVYKLEIVNGGGRWSKEDQNLPLKVKKFTGFLSIKDR